MIEGLRSFAEELVGFSLTNVSDIIIISLAVISFLLVIVSIYALIVEIYLAIKYHKYNRKQNSIDLNGKDIARKILDDNGLQNIKVKSSGSLLFGNSYSHYFKKVRLRRLTWKKNTISSLAMASQKSCLAILDKENDPDMKTRVRLTPLIYCGPLFFIPLIIIGAILDILVLKSNTGTMTIIFSLIGLLFYLLSFIMSLKVLKTEKKAQEKAYELLKKENMVTEEELDMLKDLFKLYNIEYVNNMIISLLELIYRVLQVIAYIQSSNNSTSN